MRCARPPVSTREAPLCEAGGPMGTEAFLQHLQELPWYEGQVGGAAGAAPAPSLPGLLLASHEAGSAAGWAGPRWRVAWWMQAWSTSRAAPREGVSSTLP